MRFTISVPDDVAEEADALARRWQKTRSAVYAMAVSQLVARDSEIARKLNQVYGSPRIMLPSPIRNMVARRLRQKRGGYD